MPIQRITKRTSDGVLRVKSGVKKVVDKLSDVRLNKSGTVGTEPILKRDKSGKLRKYIEVKAGKLGALRIPTRDVRGAEDDFPPMGRGKRK